jgi:hypothetical protein
MRKIFLLGFLVGFTLFGVCLNTVSAYEIQELTGVEDEGDFVLGPGKTELWLSPGEEITDQLLITNRLGKTMDFEIEIEDFRGSRNPGETIVLLGEEKGPYSLKDFLQPEITEFTLEHGQRMILPVKISIPEDAEPGGLYGSVLVSTSPPRKELEIEEKAAKSQMRLISRLGCLYFIRVKGEVEEDGFLKELRLKRKKKFFEQGPISFELLFENNGNVHLMPYGGIEIFNVLGNKVDEIEIEPYFSLPDSLRLREVKWQKGFLFGRYTALASVNRGYQDIIDQESITFWVIPWKIITAGLIGFFLVVWFFRWLFKKFEIKRKL